MTTKHELGLMMAALFSAFGRELTEVDVDAWHLVLGDLPREELATSIWQACKTLDQMPVASKIRRLVLDRRASQKRNMSDAVRQSMAMGVAVKAFRLANPGCTADEVCEFVSRLERQITNY